MTHFLRKTKELCACGAVSFFLSLPFPPSGACTRSRCEARVRHSNDCSRAVNGFGLLKSYQSKCTGRARAELCRARAFSGRTFKARLQIYSHALTRVCGLTSYQNKEQRNSDYNTHRGSVTSFSAQDAITPLYLYIANSCLELY